MNDDEKLDFAPLDPRADALRFEARARGIVSRAAPTLAARRARAAPVTVLEALARSWRLAAAAASATIGTAALALLLARGDDARAAPAARSRLDAAMVGWALTGRSPTAAELLALAGAAP